MTIEMSAEQAARSGEPGEPRPVRLGLGLENRLRNLAVVSAIAFALGCLGFFGYAIYQVANREIAGLTVPNDFSVMWAAAKLALEGRPMAAFDVDILNQTRNLPPWTGEAGYRMAWHYPGHFHALITPFGLLPFMTSWLLFSLVWLSAFAVAMKWLVRGPAVTAIAVASPAVLMCLMHGQNTLLIGALLAAFLAFLRDGRVVLAGIVLGVLTIKPQFGPLLPLALIMIGAWRVIAVASITAIGLLVASLLWLGVDYWWLFLDRIGLSAEWIETGWLPRHLMVTWYAFALGNGLEAGAAKLVQMGASAAVALAVALTWRRRDLAFEIKAAILVVAIPLVTPYAYLYDLVLPMIASGLLLSSPAGQRPLGFGAAALLWTLPTLAHVLREIGFEKGFALIGAPILTLAMGAILLSAVIPNRTHPPADTAPELSS